MTEQNTGGLNGGLSQSPAKPPSESDAPVSPPKPAPAESVVPAAPAAAAPAAAPPVPAMPPIAGPAKPATGAPTVPPKPAPKPVVKPEPWSSPLLEEIKRRFPDAVTEAVVFRNQPCMTLAKQSLIAVCEFLKTNEGGAYVFLTDEK